MGNNGRMWLLKFLLFLVTFQSCAVKASSEDETSSVQKNTMVFNVKIIFDLMVMVFQIYVIVYANLHITTPNFTTLDTLPWAYKYLEIKSQITDNILFALILIQQDKNKSEKDANYYLNQK